MPNKIKRLIMTSQVARYIISEQEEKHGRTVSKRPEQQCACLIQFSSLPYHSHSYRRRTALYQSTRQAAG